MPTPRFILALGPPALMALAGCASIPDLGPPPAPRAATSIAAEQSFANAAAGWPNDRWWADYGDAQLTQLIEDGLRQSPAVAAAAARFRRAAAIAREERSGLFPSLTLDAGTGLEKQSYNNGFPKQFLPKGWQDRGQIALNFGFDLDLWGKRRATLAAALGEARAAEIDAQQARLMLTTGIADAYADLARLYRLREIRQRTLALREQTRRLVADREASGLETRGSVRQAEANLATARGDLAETDEAIALRRNQIAVLVGAGPDRALTIMPPQLANLSPHGLPADVTTDLVVRRPDVSAALLSTDVAASRIKAARADFYPAIRLSALIGVQSLGLSELIAKDSIFGNTGPAISLPIFQGGAIGARYRGARAMYDETVADYNGIVLDAFRQVADAVTSRRSLDERASHARAALAASEQAYTIARLRYEGGLSTFLDVIEVEDRLLAARSAVAGLDARAFALDVALIRALGGGFGPAAASHPKDPTHG